LSRVTGKKKASKIKRENNLTYTSETGALRQFNILYLKIIKVYLLKVSKVIKLKPSLTFP
jgi:hypothetical protein